MSQLRTGRLLLRPIRPDDAAFYFELVNTDAWLTYIGDKGIRSVEQARESIINGPMAMREQHGVTFHVVSLLDDPAPLGVCGLILRDTLPGIDIGYAFLPTAWGRGYAREAAQAVAMQGRDTLGLTRLFGIVSPGHEASIRVLEHLGMRYRETLKIRDDGQDTLLYAVEFGA